MHSPRAAKEECTTRSLDARTEYTCPLTKGSKCCGVPTDFVELRSLCLLPDQHGGRRRGAPLCRPFWISLYFCSLPAGETHRSGSGFIGQLTIVIMISQRFLDQNSRRMHWRRPSS